MCNCVSVCEKSWTPQIKLLISNYFIDWKIEQNSTNEHFSVDSFIEPNPFSIAERIALMH